MFFTPFVLSHYLFRVLFAAIFSFLLFTGECRAWYTPQHGAIARNAFEKLPEEMRNLFAPWRGQMLLSSLEPDISIMDWDNHEWNIHRQPEDTTSGPERIDALFRRAKSALLADPPDLEAAARDMGLLAHYMADLAQPLHTDAFDPVEESCHLPYEFDVYKHQDEIKYEDRGLLPVKNPMERSVAVAREANRFYESILTAYSSDKGYENTKVISRLGCQSAVDNIADAWTTIWADTMKKGPSLFLETSMKTFRPDDLLEITVSATAGRDGGGAFDLYLLLESPASRYLFIGPGPTLSDTPVPFLSSWPVGAVTHNTVCSVRLGEAVNEGRFRLYGLLVKEGGDIMAETDWIGRPVYIDFVIEALPAADKLLDEISDEVYLFPARDADGHTSFLPLMRWDVIFVGSKQDNPLTDIDESVIGNIIPGDYSHLMLYLGLDKEGRPTVVEMVPDIMGRFNIRLTRLTCKETGPPDFQAEPSMLPVFNVDISMYGLRNAMRLAPSWRDMALAHEKELLERIAMDMEENFPYQYEYQYNENNFFDAEIRLVDDGRKGGAGCTDYILSLFEEYAGICITGARANALEVTEYFRHPPGSSVQIPDYLNPLPFSITVTDVLNMGYHLVDPPPHLFPCDIAAETGVPLPARVMASPAFVPVPAVEFP